MKHSIVTVVVAASVGLFVWGVFLWRASQTSKTQTSLCTVLFNLVDSSQKTLGKPHTPLYAYYKIHPDELAFARRRNLEALRKLPCRP